MGFGLEVAFAVIVAAFWAFSSSICVAGIFSEKCGERLADMLIWKREYLRTPPELLSPIKGMIAQEQYEEALEALQKILDEKPFAPEPFLMMVEVYMDNLHNHSKALELMEAYFANPDFRPLPENIEMAMHYCDLCQQYNRISSAIAILERELARPKGYSEPQKKLLRNRLEVLV
jgi:tetratricopeptide (TPR) repeat protein